MHPNKPRNRKLCFLFCSILFISQSKAQYIDSATNAANHKPTYRFNNYDPQLQKPFPVKSLLVPAFMVAYGFTTLKSNHLIGVNEKIHEEVWLENPHKKKHIDNFLPFAPALAVYGLNMAGIHGKNNLKDRTILYLMSSVIVNGTVFSIKNLTNEQRPDQSGRESFPSGHTAQAFASAEFLRQEYKDVSPWYGLAGYAAATLTGTLRMYNNKHWLGDVVAGAGVGIASTKIAYWLYPTIKRKFFQHRSMNTVIMPYYQDKTVGFSMTYQFH
jgi:hypothetical protein